MFFSKKILKLICTAGFAVAMACTGAFGLYAAEITGDGVNFRETANGTVMSTLYKGTQVAVIDNSTEWFKIAVGGVTGYVKGTYIAGMPDCEFELGSGEVECQTSVNVRSAPGTGNQILTTVSSGTSLSVVGINSDWYKVVVGDTVGYMSSEYVNINGRQEETTSRTSTSTSSADALRAQVIAYAEQFLGTPYVWGGSTPSGFDCSGFMYYVYGNLVREIPRTATAQLNSMTKVSYEDLQPADLVFFGSGDSITHVGMYVGDGMFIHSPQTGDVIKYSTLASGSYNTRFVSGGRVIFD